MNTMLFIIGFVIFTLFILGIIWEINTEEKSIDENYGYYSRHQPEQDEIK